MKRAEAIRWTQERAAAEFGINPRTVAARLKTAGMVPGKDGRFSTADIHQAICGDIDAERLRKTREEADKLALENAVARGELVDVQDFIKRYEPIYAQIRQTIMASNMPDADKDALLTALAKLHSNKGGPRPDARENSPRAGRAAVAKAKA